MAGEKHSEEDMRHDPAGGRALVSAESSEHEDVSGLQDTLRSNAANAVAAHSRRG
jgi:hypothetical protein